MKCPICGKRKISVGRINGYDKNPVKECADCGAVWTNDGTSNHIIFKGK